MPQYAGRVAVLALILIVLGSAKLSFSVGRGPLGADGSNYFQIARNVAEGRGLVTNLSLYHLGYASLPARSFQTYPLWPLLLGYTGRLVGMFRAVDILGRLFYLAALIGAWFVANAAARGAAGREVVIERWPMVDFGHVGVLLLGTNAMFFMTTSYPYTEGLSFTLMFASIGALSGRVPAAARGALAGLLAGLAFLTRTQMVLVAPAALAALAWLVIADRRYLRAAVAFAAVSGACAAYWYFGVFRLRGPRVDIPVFQMWVQPGSVMDIVRDRLHGVAISFDPRSGMSYFNLFGPAAALPLVAALYAISGWRRLSWRAVSERLPMLITLLAGLLFTLTLYRYHETFFLPWLFGYRHGLGYILLFFVAVPYLASAQAAALRWTTVLLVTLTIVMGLYGVVAFLTAPRANGPSPAEAQLSAWLESHPRPPTLITTNAQTLSVWSHANFHWMLCRDSSAQPRVMLEKLPIDYVLVYEAERQCGFAQGLTDVLAPRASFGQGRGRITVLGRRR